MTVRFPLFRAGAFALLLTTAGCGGSEVTEIEDVRERGHAGVPAPRSTLDQRMRGEMPGDPHGADPHGAMGGAASSGVAYTWSTPAGWEPLPAAPMRAAGWKVTAAPGTECTFSTLPASGGGFVANVNRWRKQMSLEPTDEAAVAALPTKGTLLGRPARWVELTGTYVGMGGGATVEGAKLVGLVAELPQATAFLKLTGPAASVDAEVTRFLELAASIAPGSGAAAATRAEPPAPAAPFQWTAPAGWTQGPARSMRVATFVPTGAPSSEVAVSILKGTAGGVRANLDRWRGQMGAAPLTDAEFEALPRAKVLGGTAVFLAVEGAYAGMSGGAGAAGSMLLGMALPRPGDMVFVKMTGPAAEVRGEQDRFRAFCESFRE
ncbi:MAG: hypothetical protein JNM10_12365 [Planctomycetia bacterium]|nr:hypothetical protein [Planctomycetia bacterium]